MLNKKDLNIKTTTNIKRTLPAAATEHTMQIEPMKPPVIPRDDRIGRQTSSHIVFRGNTQNVLEYL